MQEYVFEDLRQAYKCSLKIDGEQICQCRIGVSDNVWTISSWYTNKGFEHRGYGKMVMKNLLKYIYEKCGEPDEVEYIWNGANEYVYEWMNRNFGAISKCPIAVMKYQSGDDWLSHIYRLNKEKFLRYFEI